MADSNSFFISGGTLGPDAQSYIERDADTRLFDGLMAGEFCYVLDARQMGKSSLMARTAGKLRGSGSKVVILDLSELGQNLTVEQWYYGLLIRLGEQLDIEMELLKYWKDNSQIGPLQRWMSGLRKVALEILNENIVIFVDEIDVVRSLPFSTDEFFAGIRECYNRRTEDSELARLSFCLIGVATPADLIRDVRTTPFNIGRRIELADFTHTEASPLAEGLSSGDRDGDKLLKRILYWTGGHPYLTQRLCQAVSESADVTNAGGVDRICEALFLTKSAREADDNLAFVRNRILRGEADLAALLDLYHQVRSRRGKVKDDDSNPLVVLLRLSGVVRVVEGYLWVRNRIYSRVFDRQWVLTNMPDAELRRQKAAYRAGVLKTAGLAGAIMLIIGSMAVYNRQLALEAQNKALLERKMRYVSDMIIAQRDCDSDNPSVGEAPNLLERNRPETNGALDLRGFEWYYLWKRCHQELQTFHGANYATLSRDGSSLATWRLGSTSLTIWSVKTGLKVSSVSGQPGAILSASFSPDGTRIVISNTDKSAEIREVTTGTKIFRLNGHKDKVNSASFSPDGKKIATASSDGTVRIWDSGTGNQLYHIDLKYPAYYVSFSTDQNLVVFGNDVERKTESGSPFIRISLWDSIKGTIREIGSGTGIGHRLSPDGKLRATCVDNSVILFNKDNKGPQLDGHYGDINAVCFSPDGKSLATASDDRTAKIWDVNTGELKLTLKGHADSITSVAFFPDGKRIMTASLDGTARIWRLQATPEKRVLNADPNRSISVSYSRDGNSILSVSQDSTCLWNAVSAKPVWQLKEAMLSAAFLPDGNRIITLDHYCHLSIWDRYSNSLISRIALQPDSETDKTLLSAKMSPDGKTILAFWNGDKAASLWDVRTRKKIFPLEGHTDWVNMAVFSLDGKKIVTVSVDNTGRLWDARNRKLISVLKGHRKSVNVACFSPPDTALIATGCADGTIMIWDANTGAQKNLFKGHTGEVTSAVFSEDGKRLITSSKDHTLRVWDVRIGMEVLELKNTTAVNSACISPDSKSIAAACNDGTISIWKAASDQEVEKYYALEAKAEAEAKQESIRQTDNQHSNADYQPIYTKRYGAWNFDDK